MPRAGGETTKDGAARDGPPTRPRRLPGSHLLVGLASVGLLAVGAARYVDHLDGGVLEIPLSRLVVSPGLEKVSSLGVAPGALAGRSLVLVTLDTTRPDRLGCYGNAAAATPQLDRLAASGVVYSHAVATASTTRPTHASILTGLYPWHHGVRANSGFGLDAGPRTLAGVLSAHGYATAAFVSSVVLDHGTGLDRGFAIYDDVMPKSSTMTRYAQRRGDATTDLAIEWLRARARQPFFLWIHYFDAHATYDPPPPFDQLDNPYDGEIAFVDAQIGRLLAALGSARVARPLVVVTADHGEGLGAHGELTHGLLVTEATLRVPLLLWAGGGLPSGVNVTERVSQVDLLPTILSLLGIPAPDGLDGVDLTGGPAPDRALFAETVEGHVSYGWAPLAAIYAGTLKYVDGPHPELYDLSSDPLEAQDVLGARRAEARALERRLDDEFATARADSGTREGLGGDDAALLRALGYVEPDRQRLVASPKDGHAMPDPNTQLAAYRELQGVLNDRDLHDSLPAWTRLLLLAKGRTFPGSTAELITRLEGIAAERPDFVPTYLYLAALYGEAGRPRDAQRATARLDELLGSSSSGS